MSASLTTTRKPSVATDVALDAQITVMRGTAQVVSDVPLSLRPSETLAVVGRNGAGKTSLLLGLQGLLPAHGEIWLGGRRVDGERAFLRARSGLAIVPQGRRLFPSMTVADNLRAATLERPGPGPEIDIHALFPTLDGISARRAGVLSGGQQQQVAIARALLRRPTVLLLDEPTEGLAPAVIQEVIDALAQLTALGLSLVVAEQHLGAVAALAHDVVVLRAGRAVARGAASDPAVASELQHISVPLPDPR